MCWARYSKGCASFTRSLVTLVDAVMTVACTTDDAPKYCEVSLGKEACMI